MFVVGACGEIAFTISDSATFQKLIRTFKEGNYIIFNDK